MTFHLYSNGKKITDQIPLSEFREEEAGIFESLRTYQGKIFRVEEHLDRFFESAKTSGFSGKLDKRKLCRELELALQTFRREEPEFAKEGDLFIRLSLFQKRIFVMVGIRVHAPELYRCGVALKTSPVTRSLSNASPPEVKTSSYQNAVLASLEPSGPETYEWLFLNRSGYVTEVRIGNLFIVKDHVLLTPPCLGILHGVTRRFVIKCGLALQLKVREVPLTRHEIFNADEAFLTNTSWEILPVRELDSRPIGKKIPGPVTLKLMRQFKRLTRRHSEDEVRRIYK